MAVAVFVGLYRFCGWVVDCSEWGGAGVAAIEYVLGGVDGGEGAMVG